MTDMTPEQIEELEALAEAQMTNDQEPEPMTLDEFQNLPPDQQAQLWEMIQLTKNDTSQILELIQPKGEEQSDDPMLDRMTDILEVLLQVVEGRKEDSAKIKQIESKLETLTAVLRDIRDAV